jgi:hypothetical protein
MILRKRHTRRSKADTRRSKADTLSSKAGIHPSKRTRSSIRRKQATHREALSKRTPNNIHHSHQVRGIHLSKAVRAPAHIIPLRVVSPATRIIVVGRGWPGRLCTAVNDTGLGQPGFIRTTPLHRFALQSVRLHMHSPTHTLTIRSLSSQCKWPQWGCH